MYSTPVFILCLRKLSCNKSVYLPFKGLFASASLEQNLVVTLGSVNRCIIDYNSYYTLRKSAENYKIPITFCGPLLGPSHFIDCHLPAIVNYLVHREEVNCEINSCVHEKGLRWGDIDILRRHNHIVHRNLCRE